jgi:hypothetical protein
MEILLVTKEEGKAHHKEVFFFLVLETHVFRSICRRPKTEDHRRIAGHDLLIA